VARRFAQVAVAGLVGANLIYFGARLGLFRLELRLPIRKALRLLRSKRETLPPKKHGNIPL